MMPTDDRRRYEQPQVPPPFIRAGRIILTLAFSVSCLCESAVNGGSRLAAEARVLQGRVKVLRPTDSLRHLTTRP